MGCIKLITCASLCFCLTVISATSVYAAKPEKMNERQHMDNQIRNKIANAKLRGMLAGGAARAQVEDAINEGQCVTQIGNVDLGSSSRPNNQDIIILGDVINVCK